MRVNIAPSWLDGHRDKILSVGTAVGIGWISIAVVYLYMLFVATVLTTVYEDIVMGPVTGALYSTVLLVPMVLLMVGAVAVAARQTDFAFDAKRSVTLTVGVVATANFLGELVRMGAF